jgi:hypothetical protein
MTKDQLRCQVLAVVAQTYPETTFACLSIDLAQGQLALNVTPHRSLDSLPLELPPSAP